MKKARKLTAFLLLAAFVFTFIVPVTAMAAGEGSITVDNPKADTTYTAYKIFDVVYDANGHYSYTIDSKITNNDGTTSDNPWFSTVQTYANGNNGLKLEPINGSTKYNVTVTDGTNNTVRFSAADFAKTLKGNVDGKTGTSLPAEKLDLGYYFVSSPNGALCNLTTTNPNATIYDKNDVPFDKEDDKESVEIGEVVNYKIKGKVPDTTGFTSYDYVITDKMSKGLTFNADSIRVWISNDDELVTETTDGKTLDTELNTSYYETPITTDAKSFDGTEGVDFRINFKAIDMNKANPSLVGKYIFITYTATVNENAVAKIEKNNATLTYSNDPTDSSKHGDQTKEETVYSAKIVINKYDANDTNKKLSGAEFVLYKEVDATAPATGKTPMYYKYTAATTTEEAKVEWVADKAQATVKETTNGVAEFIGLKDGDYKLLETKAPDGYNLLQNPVPVKIKGTNDDNKTVVEANLTHTENVANSTGSLLPSTGGIGTTIFYAVGAVLVVGAGVLLVTKRRMSGQR